MTKPKALIFFGAVAVCVVSVVATLLVLNVYPELLHLGRLTPRLDFAGLKPPLDANAPGSDPWAVVKREPAAPLLALQSAARYTIFFSPHVERDIFLLDTQEGRVWQFVTITNLNDEPQAWKYVERVDNISEDIAFANRHGFKDEGRNAPSSGIHGPWENYQTGGQSPPPPGTLEPSAVPPLPPGAKLNPPPSAIQKLPPGFKLDKRTTN